MSKFRRAKWAMLLWASCVLAQGPTLSSLIHDGRVSPTDSILFEREVENRLSDPNHSVQFTDLGSIVRVPTFVFPFDPSGTDRFDSGIGNEFGKKFSKAFEFIDLQDVLVTIANRPDREPWSLYDEPGKRPLLQRWDHATSPETSIGSLMDLARIVGDDPAIDFRTRSITAGGDIFVNGKGYYRVSAHERDAVLANPFLSAEVVDDPWPPSETSRTFLIRHRYPSAGNYEKIKDHLSPALLADLSHAGAKLKDESSEEFKKLTQRILRELTEWAMQSNISPLLRYQLMISIHPLDDYNGRTTRALFKRQSGHALFLRNFDQDLFLSYPELALAEFSGRTELRAIRSGLAKAEKANPGFPDFFRTPELWMVEAGVDAKVDKSFVSAMSELFRQPEFINLVRQKQYYDVEQRLHARLMDGKSEVAQCILRAISNPSQK